MVIFREFKTKGKIMTIIKEVVKHLDPRNGYSLILTKKSNGRVFYSLVKFRKNGTYEPIFSSLIDFSNNRNAERSFCKMISNIRGGYRNYELDIKDDCGYADYALIRSDEVVVMSDKQFSSKKSARRSFNNIISKIEIW